MANGGSRCVLITVPRSARIVFVPLVTVQKDSICLLHCIKRTVCNICPGSPYIINCISSIIADAVTHSSDCSWWNAATCSPFSQKPVKIEEFCSHSVMFKMGKFVVCFRVVGIWRVFLGTLRVLSVQFCFHFSSGSLPGAHCGGGGVRCVLQKNQNQKHPHFSEVATILRTWSSVSAQTGSQIPFKNCWVYILHPPPRYTYAASCEDRYCRPAHIRAASSWRETPLNQQLTHSAFVSAFCFALWRVCYSSLIPSWQKYG